MIHPMVAALEDAFWEARTLDLPLGARLTFVADVVRKKNPVFAAAVDTLVTRLESVQAGNGAPKVGEAMPSFMMPNHEGRFVTLESLLEAGPVVLAFHRGHWCPYCRLNIAGLVQIENAAQPAQIVAISSEVQHYTRQLRSESGAAFPFLTDVGGGFALSINLAFLVDERMASMIAGAGWDVSKYQGGSPWILPIPAVFVIGQDGVIVARHVDPDYRRRMDLEDLLSSIDLVRSQ